MTLALLESFGYEYVVPNVRRSEGASLSAAAELAGRSREIRGLIRQTEAKVVLTRNPSGVLAAVGTGAKSVFDTDDGRNAGIHYWLSRPLADIVTSSHLDPEHHGPRHRRYLGIKAQMLLHPKHFGVDRGTREKFGITSGPLFVARFSAYTAVHDRKARGIPSVVQTEVIRRLRRKGAVLISREGIANRLFLRDGSESRLPVPPEDFHHLLAASDIYIGDSQSVAAEAAVLGVPTLHMSSFSGRLFYLKLLERRHLVRSFASGNEEAFLDALEVLLNDTAAAVRSARNAAAVFNKETGDPSEWYVELVKELMGAQ